MRFLYSLASVPHLESLPLTLACSLRVNRFKLICERRKATKYCLFEQSMVDNYSSRCVALLARRPPAAKDVYLEPGTPYKRSLGETVGGFEFGEDDSCHPDQHDLFARERDVKGSAVARV